MDDDEAPLSVWNSGIRVDALAVSPRGGVRATPSRPPCAGINLPAFCSPSPVRPQLASQRHPALQGLPPCSPPSLLHLGSWLRDGDGAELEDFGRLCCTLHTPRMWRLWDPDTSVQGKLKAHEEKVNLECPPERCFALGFIRSRWLLGLWWRICEIPPHCRMFLR